MISIERISELVEYRQGELYWKINRQSGVKAGDLGGSVDIIKGKPYKKITLDGYRLKVHRVVFAIFNGCMPDGEIDHIDGNGLNNKIENIRCVTRQENSINKKFYATNSSGFSGVNFHKNTGKWVSRISVKGSRICLGCYDDLDEAIKAKKEANEKYGFHKNHGMKRPL